MPSLKAMAREAQKAPKGTVEKQPVKRRSMATAFKSTERVADSDMESETESESGTDPETDPTEAAPLIGKLNERKISENGLIRDHESEEGGAQEVYPQDEESEQEDEDEDENEVERESGGSLEDEDQNRQVDGDEAGDFTRTSNKIAAVDGESGTSSEDDEDEAGDFARISDKTTAVDRESDIQNTPSESGTSSEDDEDEAKDSTRISDKIAAVDRESGTGSEDETDEEEQSAIHNDQVTDMEMQSHASEERIAHSVVPEHIVPYKPPAGFELIPASDGRMKVVDIFSTSHLAGKQLWYITAPASVPINSVKQVSLEDVQLGKPALSLNGHDYGFVREIGDNRGHDNFLIPDKSNPVYCIGERAIDQTLHLQQIVSITELSTNTVSQIPIAQNSTSVLPSSMLHPRRPARKQPDGLRMRFRPIGFGIGKPGTIGSTSSSSNASSSGDDETDKAVQDIQAPAHLHQRLGNASGEPERLLTLSGAPILPPQSLKRKRIGPEGKKALESPVKNSKTNSKTNGTSSGSAKASKLLLSSQTSTSNKSNGTPKPKNSSLGSLATPSRAVKNTPILPPRPLGARTNASIENSVKKTTPVPLPRSTPILPPSRTKPASNNAILPPKIYPAQSSKSPLLPSLPKVPSKNRSKNKSQGRSEKLHGKEGKDILERQQL